MNNEHRNLYLGVIAVLVVLLIVMMASWDYQKDNAQALAKAAELNERYEAAGLKTADVDDVARVLGDDAAIVCEPISNGAELGALKSRMGVGGEFFFRSTKVDDETLLGIAYIVAIYCPDELPDLQDFLDDFDFEPDLLDLGSSN